MNEAMDVYICVCVGVDACGGVHTYVGAYVRKYLYVCMLVHAYTHVNEYAVHTYLSICLQTHICT